jgi:hypothetical protein
VNLEKGLSASFQTQPQKSPLMRQAIWHSQQHHLVKIA